MNYIVVIVFAAFIVFPFITWKPNIAVADSTPAMFAPLEYPSLYDCNSRTVQWAELVMPRRDELVVAIEAR